MENYLARCPRAVPNTLVAKQNHLRTYKIQSQSEGSCVGMDFSLGIGILQDVACPQACPACPLIGDLCEYMEEKWGA